MTRAGSAAGEAGRSSSRCFSSPTSSTFLDRQILGILALPIKADLHLSNSSARSAGPPSPCFMQASESPPAYLADRTSRSAVVAGSLAVWSGFTALVRRRGGLLVAVPFRLGVGVGEAGGVAPSYALIADYFPAERRARALAIFSLGIPLGLGGGAFIGAQLADGSAGARPS